jgi:hypothetical protein
MKRKHTEAWLKRHVTRRSKEYNRQFARTQMKRFIEQQKAVMRGGSQIQRATGQDGTG